MSTRSKKLRDRAAAMDSAMKRAELLISKGPDSTATDRVLAVVKDLCNEYLNELMKGANTFYHTSDHFGSYILRAYFGEDFYEWTCDLADDDN